MRKLPFFLSFVSTVGLIVVLNTPFGKVPALGKFFDPFGGFWQNAESTKSFSDETYDLKGLKESVQVYFDDRLVPHIFAKNNEDLYFMQGYITAKFRLWQMEVQTQNAAGRVSEIVGEKALESDRLQRRIGLGFGAEKAQEFIAKDEESQRMINAYCNGVNSFIKNLKPKDYPLEYKLLGYAPEEWTSLKVALLLKNMANMLSVYEFDIENSNFISKYGEEQFKYLYPEKDDFKDFIIPEGTNWDFKNEATSETTTNAKDSKATALQVDHDLEEVNVHPQLKNSAANILEKPDDITGSNNWAVSGSKTKSGKPILCNDPHLQLNLPSIWYEMHLVSPSMNVYGATLPGSPAVISGFNDSIAWGVTNAGRDVRDWFKIQFKDDSHNEYLVDGKWEKTDKRVEHFKMKGATEFLDTVLYTRYGPIVFDETFSKAKSKNYLAMKWTAHLPSNEFKTFYLMNQGKNYDDYISALNTYTCPAQNFVFASRSGDVAIKQQGKYPLASNKIADGTDSKTDWNFFIPNEHNPQVKNPERGFVSSANQFPVDALYPYPISRVGIYENFRAMRINQLLSEASGIDADFMKKMQLDNYNELAAMALPTMLRVLDKAKLDKEELEVVRSLASWNYFNDASEKAPIFFEEWSVEFYNALWDEMLDPSLPMKKPNLYFTAEFIQKDSSSSFYDNLQTGEHETRESLLLISFDKTVQKLKEKNGSLENVKDWGTYKATMVHHLSPALDAFSSMNVYCGGNRGIINATNATHGPSWRMIVDFGDMKGYCVYPGGQSGNPGSKFYDSMIEKWAKGEYFEAHFTKDEKQYVNGKLFSITANSKP